MSFPTPSRPRVQFHGADGTEKFRPSKVMRAAIAEVLARTQAGWKPEYEATATKHKVKRKTLETLVYKYRKGLVDIGDPVEIEQKQEIELRAELERSLRLLAEYERHLNDSLEQLLEKADAEAKDGNLLAFDQLGIPAVVQQIAATTSLRAKKEKGVLQILGELMELQKRRESAQQAKEDPRPVNGCLVHSAVTRYATTQETIRNAFRRPADTNEQE